MGCCSNFPPLEAFKDVFFNFGYDCGSVFRDILELFKTFQKISATHSFRTKFSPECANLFTWAINFINIITSAIKTNPLSDFESYYIITLVFPLSLLMFFSSVFSDNFLVNILMYGLCLTLGTGIGYIGIDYLIAILCSVISSIFLLLGLIYYFTDCFCSCCGHDCFCCECLYCCSCLFEFLPKKEDVINYIDKGGASLKHLFYGLPSTMFFIYLLLIPIMLGRERLIKTVSIVTGIIIVICILIYLIIFKWCDNDTNYRYIGEYFTNILTYVFFLLIIPSTSNFVELMQGWYKNDWRCIVSYVGFSILLPTAIAIMFIYSNYEIIAGKYNTRKAFNKYIELVETIKELVYAVLAGYDLIWGCFVIEIAWVVFIFAIRPYKYKSEYVLTIGKSVVECISNAALLIANHREFVVFSLGFSIALVILASLPVILSLYVYFAKDYNFEIPEEKSTKAFAGIVFFFTSISPIAWGLYGLNLSLFK